MTKGPRARFAFDCDLCGRRIGAKRTHLLTGTGLVCCTRCADSTRAHKVVHPACRQSWHDLYDHPHVHTSRAGAWCSIQGARDGHPNPSKHDDHPSKLPTQRQAQCDDQHKPPN